MSKDRITVECLATGQPRPYADTFHTYRLMFEWQGMEGCRNPNAPFIPRDKLAESTVKRYARAIYNWTEEGDAYHDWASPHLQYLKNVGPGIWEFSVKEEYTD